MTSKKRVEKAFQPKGEPKPGRKVSKPKVRDGDSLSSAHDNESFRKDVDRMNRNNRGGRAG